MRPCDPIELVGIVGEGDPEAVGEQAPDVLGRLMDGGGDDVRWSIARELDDELAQIRLDHAAPVCLQGVIQLDLLGDHRLRLDDLADTVGLSDRANVFHRLLGVSGEEDGSAHSLDRLCELGEVPIEIGERVDADVPSSIPHLAERAVVGDRAVPQFGEPLGSGSIGGGVVRSERSRRSIDERDRLHHESTSPARISAMCRTCTRLPRLRKPPSMCMRQLMSPPTTMSAPVCSRSSSLKPRIAADTSGISTAKRPPKPQHCSASVAVRRSSPWTESRSASAWARSPRFRRP